MTSRLVYDKTYRIYNAETKENWLIQPGAVEKCMTPGEFLITPIEVSEDDEWLLFRWKEGEIQVEKEKLRMGKIHLEETTFSPKVIRKKNGCNPCTNCGRCSW